ncbi:PQQ-binding-like beta-propeller repeat protein [Nocardia otitidiscaviarum]|uniref:PQQ-binding-like beta-propeller repeat protein n=1 Tax=Nocardia otitidiscaviarum TaxID=1823 RepID=A0A516NGK8_9NOCA|nr:PQQ-binding-like beta-propeller repeat protein [Nocardia otitidiscaviarum]MCP9623394.1 PQQ-binding-like beta-propeller repeat protein [Nocardia otitidiscaviarum]QDP78007.1 PQQ-binding-like beta-propeller repeat protein [Nocardia otitidiscaviarum]
MLAPERRTRADIVIAAAIAALVAIAAVVVWWTSDARSTESVTADRTLTAPPTPDRLPSDLRELWRAPDGAAQRALTVGGVAVTADGSTVTGRDPRTGEQVWMYRRDLPLCGVESQFGMVVATYRDDRGCSQTTQLYGETGARQTARSSYMDDRVELTVDGTHVLALGPRRLEMWRSDLVRTLEYGYVDAPVNPNTQPRSGCRFLSAASSSKNLAVLERCPDEDADRLTVQNSAPKDATVPDVHSSHVLTAPGGADENARVLAVSDSRVALYLPRSGSSEPRLALYDISGNPVANYPLPADFTDGARTARIGSTVYAFTGNSLIALNSTTLAPSWILESVLGTPALMSGRLLVPVADGLAAVAPDTGATSSLITVRRSDYHGEPISVAVVGPTVLERRGGQLYALGGDAP